MLIYHDDIQLRTVAGRPSYHDIKSEVQQIVKQSNVTDGVIVVSSSHTTCSLFFEETMHDTNFFGDDYLHVDINNIMDTIVPRMTSENQYNSPGPKHIEFGKSLADPNYPAEEWVMLNTDAHLRSSIYGSNSVTFILKKGEVLLGELGRIYFVDWDQLRERVRTIHVLAMGK